MNIRHRNFANGRIASFCIYIVYAIFIIISGAFHRNIPFWELLLIILLLLGSVLALILAQPGRRMKPKNYARMQCFFMICAAVLNGFIYHNINYILYMFLIQSVSMFIFMEADVYRFHVWMMGVGLVFFVAMEYLFGRHGMMHTEHIFGFSCLLLVQWLIISIINANNEQTRHMAEQERGLDDMTRVLEAKCYESRRAFRSKTEFLSNMSHEIRTPINSVLGLNEMILRETKDENIRQYAMDIKGSGRVLLAIINDILDYSKIETGNLEIRPRTYRFAQLMDDLLNVLNVQLEDRELKFEYAINPEIPKSLYGDDMRLRQVISNLLGNAIERSKENRISMRVSGEQREGDNYGLRCEILSYGAELSEDEIEELYRGFEKYENGLLEDCYGPELSITITAQILRCMGCDLVIKTDEERGAIFAFTVNQEVVNPLPVGEVQMAVDTTEKEQKEKKELYAPNAKVLVVDDNEMNRKVFSYLLKKTGIYVDQAESGKKCLDLAKERRYDIIFMDHMMPEMDGIETFHLLRSELNLCNSVPVVALTANAVSGVKEKYLKEGFDSYLSKPVMPKYLEEILFEFLPEDKIEEKK
ncbi:MAG: response regulator [Eubacterium sp.]|nr:response regulator [Eubacterium sp.]